MQRSPAADLADEHTRRWLQQGRCASSLHALLACAWTWRRLPVMLERDDARMARRTPLAQAPAPRAFPAFLPLRVLCRACNDRPLHFRGFLLCATARLKRTGGGCFYRRRDGGGRDACRSLISLALPTRGDLLRELFRVALTLSRI